MNKKMLLVGFMFGFVTLSGCSTMYNVDDEKIKERTAFALGLDEDQITISGRKQDGMMTDYIAKTNKGVEYRCNIYGGIGAMGQTSAATCNKKGEVAKKPLTGN